MVEVVAVVVVVAVVAVGVVVVMGAPAVIAVVLMIEKRNAKQQTNTYSGCTPYRYW